MTNQPTWTDKTEADWRKWHKEHYGVEAPELKFPKKEESMPTGDFPEQGQLPPKKEAKRVINANVLIGPVQSVTPGTVFDESEPDKDWHREMSNLLKPVSKKRTRRPKGIAPGVTVETYKEATVHVVIPARPEGMKKVTIRLLTSTPPAPGQTMSMIEWPAGVTALDAITAFLIRPAK